MGKRKLCVGLVVMLTMAWCAANAAWADDDMRVELRQAQDEIAALRAELQAMRNDANWQYQQELAEAMGPAPEAGQEGGGAFILPAGWTIRPYGYIKADVSWNDSRSGPHGNYVGWALPETRRTRADKSISFTAQQTRLGAIITAPNIGDLRVRGVVETDFYGAGDDNVSALRIRKAYADIIGDCWMFRFGQDWELISPLYPDTLNFMFGAISGNAGFRYPGFRFDRWWTMADDSVLTAQVGWMREMPHDLDGFGVEDGRDGGWGSALARVAYGKDDWEVGLSGHFGREEIDWDYIGQNKKVYSYSANVDYRARLWQDLMLQGEWYIGENYDSHVGALNGVRVDTDGAGNYVGMDEIQVSGGWIELGWKPAPAAGVIAGAAGFGYVDPIDRDLADDMMSLNIYWYGNVKYYLSSYLWTGLELSYFNTSYKGPNTPNGDNVRVQHSWVLQF